MTGVAMVYHPNYSQVILPEKHRFPMTKFALLHAHLLEHKVIRSEQLVQPSPAPTELLELAHCPHYLQRFFAGELDAAAVRRQGLPWSPALVQRSVTAVGGTVETVRQALHHGLACHLAGGTHHAHRDFGTGYCLLNDLAVAALWAVETQQIKRVLIVDCDVHQGDGTARILEQRPEVFTLSLHAQKNFPARKAQSDLDVPLDNGLSDTGYLQALQQALEGVLQDFEPELVIYDAGADVHADDRLGLLELSDAGMQARDRYVIRCCLERSLPVACVIGGGYDNDVGRLAARHGLLHRSAMAEWRLHQGWAA